jgi:transposase-like protein
MAGRKTFNEQDARRCLAAARSSRAEAAAWARAHGIDGRSLNAWRVNLESRGEPRSAAECRGVPRRRGVVAPKLVELVPAAAQVAARAPYVLHVRGVEIEVGRRLQRAVAASSPGTAEVMLSLAPTVRVFVAVEPIDMRGSFDALAGAVRRLGLDPVDGHLYLLLNKRRRLAKALWFDGSGWCVLAKRLEAGSWKLPPRGGHRLARRGRRHHLRRHPRRSRLHRGSSGLVPPSGAA